MAAKFKKWLETHFKCGHPRTPENSYSTNYGRNAACRDCKCSFQRKYISKPELMEWKREYNRIYCRSHQEKIRQYRRRYWKKRGYGAGAAGDPNRLAYLMYYQLRMLMKRDGNL